MYAKAKVGIMMCKESRTSTPSATSSLISQKARDEKLYKVMNIIKSMML
jgi:hypothetical protein